MRILCSGDAIRQGARVLRGRRGEPVEGLARVALVVLAVGLANPVYAQVLEGFLLPATPVQVAREPINRPDVLDLEQPVAVAELILVVRLADVTETRIVHGGQNVQVTQQYRFEPVRVLKGIFARDELLMTGQDLGVYRFAAEADRLERGQLLLVLLGRQGQNFFNCNGASTLGQSIPRLEGKDDPLLAAVDVLIGMTRMRDRAERVRMLRDGLKRARGREAAPLLLSFGRRAWLAARDPEAAEAVLPHLKAPSTAVRLVAARTLETLLGVLPSKPAAPGSLPIEAARALTAALGESGPDLATRVALIDALGSAGGPAVAQVSEASVWMDVKARSTTFAETAARLRALGKIARASAKDEVARRFNALLLDAPGEIQEDAGRALGRLDPRAASTMISSRLARKAEAGLDVTREIALLGELPQKIAAPALRTAWNRPLNVSERLAFAQACATVADVSLIPAVSTLLDPRQWQTRAFAMEALRRIDTDEAASALWPHLDEEVDAARKLRLIAFLGRHGFHEGYAQAIEHLSQAAVREEAVAAVAATGGPRAIPELLRIWRTSHDLAWNAAAIRALARLGQQDIAPRLLEIARAPGDPLADSALIALGDLGTADALPIVREALNSRRDALVIAAARSASRLLPHPDRNDDVIRDRLAALLADPDASLAVRQDSLQALASLDDPRLGQALEKAVRDANLEGTPLLNQVEQALAKRR